MQVDFSKAVNIKRICYLKSKTKKDAIHELVELIKNHDVTIDYKILEKNIIDRESLMSTGIGLGVGIPHVRMENVKEPLITIGISKESISDYESMDNQGVQLVVLIVAGTKQHKEYLKLLAAIVRKIKNANLREKIIEAQSVEEIHSIFVGKDDHNP